MCVAPPCSAPETPSSVLANTAVAPGGGQFKAAGEGLCASLRKAFPVYPVVHSKGRRRLQTLILRERWGASAAAHTLAAPRAGRASIIAAWLWYNASRSEPSPRALPPPLPRSILTLLWPRYPIYPFLYHWFVTLTCFSTVFCSFKGLDLSLPSKRPPQ